MSTIRVALAEDNVLLREGVSRLVSAHPDFELVGVASDLPELLDVIERCEPDVVITDIRMPPTGTRRGHPGRRLAPRAPTRRSAWWC